VHTHCNFPMYSNLSRYFIVFFQSIHLKLMNKFPNSLLRVIFLSDKMNQPKAGESITSRVARLNQILQSPYCKGSAEINSTMTLDALQDALLALFEECNKESLKKEPIIAEFIEKCRQRHLMGFHLFITVRFLAVASTVEEIKSSRAKPGDFNVLSMIGKGNFGKIELVREKATRNIYAMKTIPKICSNGQREV
jgi:citron Rho-interacting kinase